MSETRKSVPLGIMICALAALAGAPSVARAEANPEVRECIEFAQSMPGSRAAKEWSQLLGAATRYGECRAELVRAGQAASLFAQADQIASAELDGYVAPLLKQVEAARKRGDALAADEAESEANKVFSKYEAFAPKSPMLARHRERLAAIKGSHKTADEKEGDRTKQAFEAWRTAVTTIFNKDWAAITAADETARPLFEEGKQALDDGNTKLAVTRLLAARAAAYAGRLGTAERADRLWTMHAIDTGIAEKIAVTLLKAYRAEGDLAGAAAELEILEKSRPLLKRDEELGLYLFASSNEQATGPLRLPAPEGDARTHLMRNGGETNSWTDASIKETGLRGKARASAGAEIPTVELEGIRRLGAKDVKQPAHVLAAVVATRGGQLTLDARNTQQTPYDCHDTSHVKRVDPKTGVVEYERVCKYRALPAGYSVTVPAPPHLHLAKKSLVELYGTISSVSGDRVTLTRPVIVKVVPAGADVTQRPIVHMGVAAP